MTFETLALVSLAALLGPLLAVRIGWHIPVVIGELLAGVLLGRTGFKLIDSSDHTFAFLASVGFALVMFVAGTHVPVRDARIRAAVGAGAVRVLVVGLVSAALGVGIAALFGTLHAPLYIVLLSSSSAALVLPIVDGLGLRGPNILPMTAQVAIADTACIVALPLVIDPGRAGRAALGSAAVIAAAIVLFFVLRAAERSGIRHRVHDLSEKRSFALELRIDLMILFSLAWLAAFTGISVMIAGFALGLVVAGVGEPRRLARQVFALTEGFLGPLFFVWLGASLDLTGLVAEPRFIFLGLVLGLAAVASHAAARITGEPIALAALSAAQLGVPVAAVTVGTQLHVLQSAEAAALIVGAFVTIAASTVGGALTGRAQRRSDGETQGRSGGPAARNSIRGHGEDASFEGE